MLAPLPETRWNFQTVAHLLNRAGFGGPPAQIERLLEWGPERSVAWLVDYESTADPTPDPEWAKPDPERAERLREMREASEEDRRKLVRQNQQEERQHLMLLRHWWLERMSTGPRPFQEKMVLFWHGHFATSAEKVRDAYLMWRQNELFRRMALGNWTDLLLEVARDPAMLIWLDQAQSRKEHPNENFARELMELFALGEGHYSEQDVTEGARALTGWSFDRPTRRFVYRGLQHDPGPKTIFGRTGTFDGRNFVEMVASHPQSAPFITSKIWNFFAGERPSRVVSEELVAEFQRAQGEFKPLLRSIFLCEDFYNPTLIRNQVKSPVQWLVGSVRMLERDLPPALVCFSLTRSLGQDLFAPPNVKGWDGGLSWITTNNLLARYNEAATLVQGDPAPAAGAQLVSNPGANSLLERRLRNARTGGIEVTKLFTDSERSDRAALLAAIERRLLQDQLKPKQRQTLLEFLAARSVLDDRTIRDAVRLVMSTPEYQLA